MFWQSCVILIISYFVIKLSLVDAGLELESNFVEEENKTLWLETDLVDYGDFDDRDWFVALPLLPISVASSTYIRNPKCKYQNRLFLQQLRNFTLWAVQMFDAAAKLPVGMVVGNQYQMGHFDECLGVSVDTGANHGGLLKGQYCLAEIKIQSSINSTADPYTMDYDPMLSAWNKIKYNHDPTKVHRDIIHWALCVPDSCTPQEVNHILQHELEMIGDTYGVLFTSTVAPKMCHTLKPKSPLKAGDIAYLIILILLITVMILSTWYDFKFCDKMQNTDYPSGMEIPVKFHSVLLCFSARQNMKNLLSVSSLQPAIDATSAVRFIIMIFAIAAHRAMLFLGHPQFTAENTEIIFRDVIMGSIIGNIPLIVDVFFAMSGVLLSYQRFVRLHKFNNIDLAVPVFERFIRLTPTYLMVVFFHATLMPYSGSGPFWNSIVVREQQRCANNWWTNLFYINNYVNVGEMCMFQTWYLAVDFHLHSLSLFLLNCVWRWPRLGYTMLGIFTTLSVVIPFIIIYLTHAPPILLPYPDNVRDFMQVWFNQNIYVPTHNRATTYFIGVIIGIMLFKLRNNTYKVSKLMSYIAFYFGTLGFGMGIMIYGYIFLNPGRPYDALEAALYGSLHRLVFGAAIAVFFFVMTFGQLETHQKFLSSKIFVVMSRLTYGAYLTHTLGLQYDQGSLRLPRIFSGYTVVWLVLADCTFSFASALFLNLLIEAPFRSLGKIIFRKI